MESKKVVLAYSGGLDTTCILFWLKEQGYQVICYTADVGQDEDFDQVKERALKMGALKAIVDDRKDEFVQEFIFPSIGFGGLYQGRYLMGTSLARPCIAKGMVQLAEKEKAEAISHGATGKGNDQVRFELAVASLNPSLKCIAPWRLPQFYQRFQGRQDLLAYAASNGLVVSATPSAPYSVDANLMHVSYESGVLEDPNAEPPSGMLTMTAPPEKWPDTKDRLKVHFDRGSAVKVENISTGQVVTGAVEMLTYLNKLAGKHGIGVIDIVEDRMIGIKSRGVYETPGATVLFAAARDLETVCLDKEVNKIRANLVTYFSEQVYNGMWFSPESEFTRKCLLNTKNQLNGHVTLDLYKANVTVVGRWAVNSLYDQELVSMDVQGGLTPIDSEGFIKTQAIRLKKKTAE